MIEKDPNGIDQHAPGAKVDAGKVRPSLILGQMARAITAVAEIGTFGAAKYTDGGWLQVPNGQQRYEDAKLRHLLKRLGGETHDPDSHKLHLAHEAWNALATLELYLREQEAKVSLFTFHERARVVGEEPNVELRALRGNWT